MVNATTAEPTITVPQTPRPTTTPPDIPGRWIENSDYVARYKFLFDRLLSPPAPLTSSVPEEVLARLEGTNLKWDNLNAFAQRALVWDTGYVRVGGKSEDTWVKIYTRCGLNLSRSGKSLANIVLRANEIDADLEVCWNAAGEYYTRLGDVSLADTIISCATEVFSPPTLSNSSVWSQDALPSTTIPELYLLAHQKNAVWINAIHTSPELEPSANTCPSKNGALVIPCTTYLPGMGWCRPTGSRAMLTWLSDLQVLANRTKPTLTTIVPTSIPQPISNSTNNNVLSPFPTRSKSTDILVICLGAAFGVAAILIGVCFMRWFHGKLQSMLDGNYMPAQTPSNRHLPVDRREA